MIETLAPPLTPIPDLRAWLTAAEEMLERQMPRSDPRHAPALAAALERLAEYERRVLAEGEPE